MGLRKNQASLTPGERLALYEAFRTLKNGVPSQMGYASRYDDYVSFHFHAHHSMTMTSPGAAHRGPAFLPWHREYLRRMELELQTINPSITIPYWDWTVDNSPHSSLWDDDGLGGDGDPNDHDVVYGGLFGKNEGRWIIALPDPRDDSKFIRRTLARGEQEKLPTTTDVKALLQEVPYYSYPWRASANLAFATTTATQPSFCNLMEGNYGASRMHNGVHAWVGGTMASIMGSPNDPAFWLVHANVDRLWATWQHRHPEHPYRPSGTCGEVGPRGHNVNDPIHPWGGVTTVASVLFHIALGYWYDTDPQELQEMAQALSAIPQQPDPPADLVHH